jgi:hypothetical protein
MPLKIQIRIRLQVELGVGVTIRIQLGLLEESGQQSYFQLVWNRTTGPNQTPNNF